MRRNLLIAVGLALVLAPAALAAPAGKWLHIKVDEQGPDGDRVMVNLPLTMVEAVLPLIEDDEFHGGHLKFNDHDMDAVKLRTLWKSLREAPDGEYITVEGREENVRVSRSGGYFIVLADDRDDESGSPEHVEIRMPERVVDALLSGTDNELNLVAAIQALGEQGEGEIIRVKDGDDHVRIWVDTRNQSQGGDTE